MEEDVEGRSITLLNRIRKARECRRLRNAPHLANLKSEIQQRKISGRWRKVEDEECKAVYLQLKPLKSLALPRGIEPLFQP